MRSHSGADARREQERPHRLLPEVSEGAAGFGHAAVAWRARATHLREHLGAGVEALGGSNEDDPQRVPADAVAEGSPGSRCQAHGRLFLRRGCRVTTWIRPTANQIA